MNLQERLDRQPHWQADSGLYIAGRNSQYETFHWTTHDEIIDMHDRSRAFWVDNHTFEADEGTRKWFTVYGKDGAIVAMFCADSRERYALPPDNIIDVSTIAASGPAKPYAKMLNYPKVRAVVTANHYGGDQFVPGEMLIGCGGLGARAVLDRRKSGRKPSRGTFKYVERNIRDKDAVYNAIKNGAFAAAETPLPVLAGVHDHVYGTFTPLAYFNSNGNHRMDSVVHMADLLDPERYDPKTLYAKGIPSLLDDKQVELPDVFKKFLDDQQQYIIALQEAYPNLHDMLRVQNPSYLVITTEKVPTRLRYPHLLRMPGSFFQIHIPGRKDEAGIHIDQDAIDTAVEQAEYPIDHARFSNLHTIVIESASIEESRRIAESLSSALRHIEEDAKHEHGDHNHDVPSSDPHEPWLLEWLRNPRDQILLAQTKSGKTTQIEQFYLPQAT